MPLEGFTVSATGREGSIQHLLYLTRERNASHKLPHPASSLPLTLKEMQISTQLLNAYLGREQNFEEGRKLLQRNTKILRKLQAFLA